MNPAALVRVVRSELRSLRPAGTVALLVVVALASAALVAGLDGLRRASDRWDDAFDEANGAHVTLYGSSPEVLADAAGHPQVVESSPPVAFVPEVELRTAAGDDANVEIRAVAADDLPTVAIPLLRQGRWAAGEGEAVLDRALALDLGVGVGDTVEVGAPDERQALEVVGVAVDLIDCFFPQCDPVPVWVDPVAIADVPADELRYQQYLRIDDPDGVDAVVTDLLGRGDVGTADWLDTRADTLTFNSFFSVFLSGFAVFIMVAAAVVIAGAITARLVSRRRDLALLKAIGCTPRQIAAATVATYVALAAVAAVVGWVLGSLLTGPLQLQVAEVLGRSGVRFSARSLVVTLVVVELIVVLATLVPAWRGGRLSVTRAMAPASARVRRRSLLGWLAARAGAGPVGVLAGRAAVGRRTRAGLTVVAVVIGVLAGVVTAGFESTLDRVVEHPGTVGAPEDLSVTVEGGPAAEVEETLAADPDVAAVVGLRSSRGTVGDVAFLVQGYDGDLGALPFSLGEGRIPRDEGEAMSGYGLLDLLGVDVGERLGVGIGADEHELDLVGWYREAEDAGELLVVPMSAIGDVEPTWFAVATAEGADAAAVAARLADRLGPTASVAVNDVELGEGFDAFSLAFLVVTLLATALALANLAATTLLAMRERSHDLAVARAVGLTPRQALLVSGVAAAVLAAMGIAIGVALGWVASRVLLDAVGAESGIGPGFGADPDLAMVGLVALVTMASAVGLGLVFGRRPATASISELVRYE